MEKILIYNKNHEISHIIEQVVSVNPYLDSFDYTSLGNGGEGTMAGFEGSFIAVSEEVDNSAITLDDIINYMKPLKINELSADCNNAILAGFDYNGDFFTFTYEDQGNFNQQLTLFLIDSTITDVTWKTENNGIKTYTKDEFIAICRGAESHKRSNVGKYWQLKQTIMNTQYQSIEDLKAVTW